MTDYSIYLVTDTQMCGAEGVAWTVERAIDGGVTLVQVRDRDADDATFLQIARDVVAVCAPLGVPVLLNDRVHLVAEAGAQGAHIGQGDLPVSEARAALGRDAILGLSISSAAQLADALPLGEQIDYLGIGPVWAQQTKLDAAPPIGLDGLGMLVAASPWPTVAIGGVNADNLGDVRLAGCDGGAVVSAVCGTAEPATAARNLVRAWQA